MAHLAHHLLGHQAIWNHLIHQAREDHLPHCLLFCGPPGIGKMEMAWALAQYLNCDSFTVKPCGRCNSCQKCGRHQAEFVFVITTENKPIKIEQTRQILHFLEFKKIHRAQVVIIDQAHLLGTAAANALLKTLEEPPTDSYLILITPYPWQLLPTIRSRASLYRFLPLSDHNMRQLFPQTQAWILQAAQGRPGYVKKIEEWDKIGLRKSAWQFLSARAQHNKTFSYPLEFKKDDEALKNFEGFIYFGYLLIRDFCFAQYQFWEKVVNRDLIENATFQSWPKHNYTLWFREWTSLHKKWLASYDLSLSLDAFMHQPSPKPTNSLTQSL